MKLIIKSISAMRLCKFLEFALYISAFIISLYDEVGYVSNQLRFYPTFLQAKKNVIKAAGERSISRLSCNLQSEVANVY